MGLWKAGGDLLLAILNFFYNMTASYGMAIILLTLTVRLLLYPLSQKSMVSMGKMQKIQPRMKVIQEKYANDKVKMNEEMMRLYKENNVNPLSGCLPLLVQLPIMILLFQVLMRYQVANTVFFGIPLEKTVLGTLAEAVGIASTVQVGIVTVLTGILANPLGLANMPLYLPGVLLIVFISFLTWFQQQLSSAGSNPQMAMMNTIMPFFMGFICLSLPGGVLIYWGTSSLAGIAQQWLVVRKVKHEMEIKPVLHRNKPVDHDKAGAGETEKEEENV